MKRSSIIFFVAFAVVFAVNYVVMAVWSEPQGTPPNGNVSAPINVGFDFQKKDGDLEVRGLVASNITLGGVTRSSWPSGGQSCNWEGTKCDCSDDSSTFADIRLTVGTTCSGGQITGVEIVNFEISSGSKSCPIKPFPKCTAGYTHD